MPLRPTVGTNGAEIRGPGGVPGSCTLDPGDPLRVLPYTRHPSFRHGLGTNAAARYGRRITQTRTLLQARPGAPSLFSGRTSAPGTPFSSDPNVRARHEPGARPCSCHRATGPALLRRPRRTAHGAGVIRIDIECAILETRQVAWRVSGLESAGNPFCAQRMVVVPDAITTNRRMSYSTPGYRPHTPEWPDRPYFRRLAAPLPDLRPAAPACRKPKYLKRRCMNWMARP